MKGSLGKCLRAQTLTAAKLLHLSVPQFSHLSNGHDDNSTYFPGCYGAKMKFYM